MGESLLGGPPDPSRCAATSRESARDARYSQRRTFFLDVTAGLIESEGLGAVTMERVAIAAGVSKPLLYRHFADRADLLIALMERCWRDIDRSVQARLVTARTFDQQLAALVTGYFDEIAAQGPVLQLLVTTRAQEPKVEAARGERYRAAEAQWSSFYREKATLPGPIAELTAAILRSALQGAAAHWLDHPELSAEECIQTCLAVMRAGLDRLKREQRKGRSALAARPAGSPRPQPDPSRS